MTDDPFTTPVTSRPRGCRGPGEPLFEFVRASDRAPMSCELRFHGESYGVGHNIAAASREELRRAREKGGA